MRKNLLSSLLTKLTVGIVSIGFLVYVSLNISILSNDAPFAAVWSLDELQNNFIGWLPADATNIEYVSAPLYSQLVFQASPESADQFVSQFCFDRLYQGFDPFSAINHENSDEGVLIKTEPRFYYFASSPNTPMTIFGNRCNDSARGGVQQVLIDRTNFESYRIQLEISVNCYSTRSPHPCDGQAINYESAGSLVADADAAELTAILAYAEAWRIAVEAGVNYVIEIVPMQTELETPDHISVATSARSNSNQPGGYCHDCWINVEGNIDNEGFRAAFEGSPTGETTVEIFWMSDSRNTYQFRVVRE